MGLEGIGSPVMWGGFVAFILDMLALDMLVFHRKAHEVSLKEALGWSVFWIGLAIAFNIGVYHWYGSQKALEFTTGYLIEKALSVDNIFVFLVIFKFFAVPAAYQHRVLFYGILGALVMRAFFILVGAALLAQFHWVIYVFGGILLVTGARMLARQDDLMALRSKSSPLIPTSPSTTLPPWEKELPASLNLLLSMMNGCYRFVAA